MAARPLAVAALAALVQALAVLPPPGAEATITLPDPFEEYTPPGVAIRREDLPLLKCEVCKKVAEKLWSTLEAKRRKATPAKPVGELDIIEISEKICDRKTIPGGWILRQDVQEDGDRLKLVEFDYDGDCRSECRTIQRACENIMGYHDTTVAELLEKPGMTQAALEESICRDLSDACALPPPPLPKDRKPGEKFEKEKPKDYGKMAEDMGIKQSVMHEASNIEIPEGMPVMPAPKHLTNPRKEKKSKNKKSKKSSRSSDWESMSEL